MEKTVYIVHAIDVEGPMTETLEATFERMWQYGLPSEVAISRPNLELVQEGRFPGLDSTLSQTLAKVFSKRLLAYLTDWDQIDDMVTEVTSSKFRKTHSSKDGSAYILSWFIYDHHDGFTNNPRFHDAGIHRVFDHHMCTNIKDNPFNDGIYWHYHQPAISGNSLESNTCWTNRTTHEEIIARRIIDRNWYFSCFRAGIHIERNDLSHWLEMFVPFDFSARFAKEPSIYRPGFEYDWRGCPNKWGGWHPDWYDYRKEGNMRRYQFRMTDLATYLNSLSRDEVEEAFVQAEQNGSSVLTYYNHEYRDMRPEITEGYSVIRDVADKYPKVNWKFVNALTAAQKHLGLKAERPGLSVELKDDMLWVKSDKEIFGPQPFLAIKEGNQYFRDNFTQEAEGCWAYRFRNLPEVKALGVAANSPSGLYDLKVIKLERGKVIPD